MKQAPIPKYEKERLLSLHKLGLLDTKPEERFDRITRTATKIFNVPISTLTLVDEKREWFKSCVGLSAKEGDRAISFCGHALLAKDVFVIPDTKKDKRFFDNPMVVGRPFIRFYAGVPIVNADGERVGVFCIKDTKPRKFPKTDQEILKNLSAWAELEINSRNLSLALAEGKKLQEKLIQNYKKTEESKVKDEAILESMGEGLVAVDNNRKIMFLNTVASKMLDLEKEDLVGKVITDLRLEDEKGNLVPLNKRPTTIALATGEITRVAYFFVKKDKTRFPIAITATPIKLDGKTIGLIEIIRDITKEKEIDKAKTEFVSLASHQLRTPLSAVGWYTEMLLAEDVGKINQEQKKYLTEVAIGNKRMVDLVNSLLNVSRLDLGTFIIEPEATNVREMAKSVVDELEPQIKEKKQKIEAIYGEIPAFQADQRLLRIIFQNLLSNAVKYTGEGGSIKLGLSIAKKDEIFGGKKLEENNVVITVSDTGMGIPDNQKAKIFSKIFRADNAQASETEGTGLGLYIVKSIIDHSGGLIWFESKENQGTTFYVAFPQDGMKKKEGSKKLD